MNPPPPFLTCVLLFLGRWGKDKHHQDLPWSQPSCWNRKHSNRKYSFVRKLVGLLVARQLQHFLVLRSLLFLVSSTPAVSQEPF